MITGGKATLYVRDVPRAVRFYVESLGFKETFRGGDAYVEVDAGGGLVLALHAAPPEGPVPGTAGSISVAFDVNQPVVDVVAVLANRGVPFRGPVVDTGHGKLAFFADPDGNALVLSGKS